MNFADEEYVRLYIRDTDTWRAIGFEGQAVLALMLRRFDSSGIYKFGKRAPARSIMAAIGCSIEFAEKALDAIMEEEIWQQHEDRFFWPTHDEAQHCMRSDRLRKRHERARKVSDSGTNGHASVTSDVENVTSVTKCPSEIPPVQPRAREGQAGQGRAGEGKASEGSAEGRPPVQNSAAACEATFDQPSEAAKDLFDTWQCESGKTGVSWRDWKIRQVFDEAAHDGVTIEQVRQIVLGAKRDKYAVESGRLMPSFLFKSSEQRAKYLDLYLNPPKSVNETPGAERRNGSTPTEVRIAPDTQRVLSKLNAPRNGGPNAAG